MSSPPEPTGGGQVVHAGRETSTVKPAHLQALKQLGLMGALDAYVKVRSGDLGEALGMSQQSASNTLVALEEAGLLERQMGSRGQSVRVSAAGVEVLRKEYTDYHSIFDRPSRVVVKGTVIMGLGEGKYYLGQEGYLRQFREPLGFPPKHGTLNLSLDSDGMNQLARLREAADLVAAGFEEEGRTFGAVKCVPCTIRGVVAAVIIPLRTHHRNVMELISEQHLRDRFGLGDGDEVEVVVEIPWG